MEAGNHGAFFDRRFVETGIYKTGDIEDDGHNRVAGKIEKGCDFTQVGGIFTGKSDGWGLVESLIEA